MVLSNFMIKQNVTGAVSRVAYPVFARVFGLSKAGCYPAVIGLLSGYPVGAKTTAQLYREKMLSKSEAQYLLTFCNNASPMFLLEYIGVNCIACSIRQRCYSLFTFRHGLARFYQGGGVFIRKTVRGCAVSAVRNSRLLCRWMKVFWMLL